MSAPHSIPPHAPKVGRARRLLGDYHVTGLFWYRFHKWAVSTLPAWTLWPITITFTTFFFCTIFNIRRAIASNLKAVLGPCGFLERQRRIYATMWTFGWCLTERYERLTTHRPFDQAIEAVEHRQRMWQQRFADVEARVTLGFDHDRRDALAGEHHARRAPRRASAQNDNVNFSRNRHVAFLAACRARLV